jgi:rhomboid family GlyGly-CTERM serine protease
VDKTWHKRGGIAAVVAVCLLLCAGGLFADALLPVLRYERSGLAAGEWWRLVSAHFVHIDEAHAALNAAALLLIAWLGTGQVTLRQWLWLTLASMAAVDIGLYWLAPETTWYAGASGVLHGVFAGTSLILARRAREPIGTLMLLLLAAKLAFEQVSGGPSPWMGSAGFRVVIEAHLYGALGGLAAASAASAIGASRS